MGKCYQYHSSLQMGQQKQQQIRPGQPMGQQPGIQQPGVVQGGMGQIMSTQPGMSQQVMSTTQIGMMQQQGGTPMMTTAGMILVKTASSHF